jgi:SET domain-containing protein
MLVVKTKLGQSKIDGIGLFADQFIPKGTVTWKFNPRFDIYFEKSEVEKMSELQKDLIICFAYLSKKSGKYVYSIDNARFANHSTNPNMSDDENKCEGDAEVCSVAIRDIQKGEEMTFDYRVIDAVDEISDAEYLNTVVL